MMDNDEKMDEEKCARCGGECCRLYVDDERRLDRYFDGYCLEWFGRFVDSGALEPLFDKAGYLLGYGAGESGVEPLHNPLEAHLSSPHADRYRKSLPGWVDIYRCQFCHPENGCLLPRKFRPAVCRSYSCGSWESSNTD